jgi:3-oxoacyl-[acyl-carrier protein] reductase
MGFSRRQVPADSSTIAASAVVTLFIPNACRVEGAGCYIATKFAVHGFTRGLSRELGATGITVNGVQPGPIDAELSPADGPYSDVMKKLTGVGRFGKVGEIASAVAFLAHPESAFINGESLTVDGGWNA